jgi:hypothetical protein
VACKGRPGSDDSELLDIKFDYWTEIHSMEKVREDQREGGKKVEKHLKPFETTRVGEGARLIDLLCSLADIFPNLFGAMITPFSNITWVSFCLFFVNRKRKRKVLWTMF